MRTGVRKIVGIAAICIIMLLAVLLAFELRPVKTAISLDEIKELDGPYYLVKKEFSSAAQWIVIGDQNGEYLEPKYADLQGEFPSVDYELQIMDNVYVCYGEYVGQRENPATTESFSIFDLSGWDILYPVKRSSVFQFWPKGYLCRIDVNGRN